jgi:hypothetical protein
MAWRCVEQRVGQGILARWEYFGGRAAAQRTGTGRLRVNGAEPRTFRRAWVTSAFDCSVEYGLAKGRTAKPVDIGPKVTSQAHGRQHSLGWRRGCLERAGYHLIKDWTGGRSNERKAFAKGTPQEGTRYWSQVAARWLAPVLGFWVPSLPGEASRNERRSSHARNQLLHWREIFGPRCTVRGSRRPEHATKTDRSARATKSPSVPWVSFYAYCYSTKASTLATVALIC